MMMSDNPLCPAVLVERATLRSRVVAIFTSSPTSLALMVSLCLLACNFIHKKKLIVGDVLVLGLTAKS